MSKKYVPSFLKQGELPNAPATASFDAFSSNRKQKENHATVPFDAFPMNKRGPAAEAKNDHAFDAFSKVKKLPEVEAFSPFHSTRTFGTTGSDGVASDPFSAFGSKTRGAGTEGSQDVPMSKRSAETSRGTRNPHLILEPMTYGGALVTAPMATTQKPSGVVVVSGKPPSAAGDGDSFASKFATKMKIVEDPSYVPPPTVVDMESEQDFPTLGVITTKTKGWAQPLHDDKWTQPIVAAQKGGVSAIRDDTEKPKKVPKKPKTQSHLPSRTKNIPVIPHHITKRQEEGKEDGEFKPIEYDEDAFEEADELAASDLDEDALFADEDDSNEEDEMDPNIYENRRPEDLY